MDLGQSEVEDFLDEVLLSLELLELLSTLDARRAIVVDVFPLYRPVSIYRFSSLHLQGLQIAILSRLLISELSVAKLGLFEC